MVEDARVSVVIPNWNGADVLGDCLDALLGQTTPATEVIVVDNGSTDGSADLARRHAVGAQVIALDTNRGFAAAVNRGIAAATAEHVVLLNNDAVADPGMLEALVATRRATGAPIVGAVILDQTGDRVDSAGDGLTSWGLPVPGHRGDDPSVLPDGDVEIVSACAGAALYDRSLFERIGDFDEDFFAYFEDVDLSLRARLAGESVWLSRAALVRHRQGHTSARLPGFTRQHTIKNLWLLNLKVLPPRILRRNVLRLAVTSLFLTAMALRHGFVRPTIRAYGALLRALPRALRHRREIQRARLLPDSWFEAHLWNKAPFTRQHRHHSSPRSSSTTGPPGYSATASPAFVRTPGT